MTQGIVSPIRRFIRAQAGAPARRLSIGFMTLLCVTGGLAYLEQHWASVGDPAGEPATVGDGPALAPAALASVESGWIQLKVRPKERKVQGLLILVGTRTQSGTLHARLPPGVEDLKTTVQCRESVSQVAGGQLAIHLGDCPPQGCVVDISWTLDASRWPAADLASRLGPDGYWLHAADVMPHLALETGRAPFSPLSQGAGAQLSAAETAMRPLAPVGIPTDETGNWRWVLQIDGLETAPPVRRGKLSSPLDFVDLWSPQGEHFGRWEHDAGDRRLGSR